MYMTCTICLLSVYIGWTISMRYAVHASEYSPRAQNSWILANVPFPSRQRLREPRCCVDHARLHLPLRPGLQHWLQCTDLQYVVALYSRLGCVWLVANPHS
jgi:hypothetical protein